MSESREHRETALRIAKRFGVQYNSGKGADIVVPALDITIEVETPETVLDGIRRQLQGYSGMVYIAGTNQKAVVVALKNTKGTTIGVMDQNGEVVKLATRRG